ncbi:MAG: hypothetical protein HY906_20385 [Deltaproteobacteria bacterium]|nr:hypothetical protein [Deltaproteobacteria bacterium]
MAAAGALQEASACPDVATAPDPCGLHVTPPPPLPPIDPCVDDLGVATVLGPTPVERQEGTPEVITLPFALPAEGLLCFHVENDGLSSASVELDGAAVFRPNDFRPQATVLERRVLAGTGPHEVSARVGSAPGTSLSLTVRFAPASLADGGTASSGHYLSASYLNAFPDQISPRDQNGVQDRSRLSANLTVQSLPGGASGNFKFLVRTSFIVAGGTDCGEVQRLAAESPAWLGTQAVVAWWDGRAADGSWAPDALYGVDLYAELVAYQEITMTWVSKGCSSSGAPDGTSAGVLLALAGLALVVRERRGR